MRGHRHLFASALALALAAGCAGPVEPIAGLRVDEGFARSGGSFSTGTRLDFRILALEDAGQLALCGAWAARDVTAQPVPYLDRAAASGVVQLAGANVLADPSRFQRLEDEADPLGAPARCFRTATPWQAEFAAARPTVSFVSQSFDRDVEGAGGGVLRFRELAVPG